MAYNGIVGECRACSPIKGDDGKMKSQWLEYGGCPYCGATGIMRVKGYLEYMAQLNGNQDRHITKRLNLAFGIKI